MNSLIPTNSSLTMTSREIADLVESRHDAVKKSIERLAERGVIELPPMMEISTATKPTSVYIFSALQGKRDSIIVVAQLSPEFTARLVDRWQELEALVSEATQAALPTTYLDALKALVASEEAKESALQQIEADKPYVEVARLITGASTMVRRDWLALMKEDSNVTIKERALTAFLIDKGYLYRDQLSRELRAYAKYDHFFKLEIEIINGSPRRLLKVTGDGVLLLTPMVVQHFSNLPSTKP